MTVFLHFNTIYLVKQVKVDGVLDSVEGVWREVIVARFECQGQLLIPGWVGTLSYCSSRTSTLKGFNFCFTNVRSAILSMVCISIIITNYCYLLGACSPG